MTRPAWEWTLITLILLIGASLRFCGLGDVPKGLEHDEVATWHMVSTVLQGAHPLYFEEGYGHEPLFNYLTAIPLAVLGDNWLGERFWAPWFGMFAVAATYALMRHLFGPTVGLGAAGLQATVLWALFFNRLGLRLNLLPFLLCATAYAFWRGLECADRPSRRFALSGGLLGLCFYTYMSARAVPILFGAFAIYLLLRDRLLSHLSWRAVWRRRRPLLVCFAVAALVMAPLVVYFINRPPTTATPKREVQVDMPLRELRRGNLKPVLDNAWALLKMWNIEGELYWQLNYSRRPVFVEPIGGLLFWAGALLVLWRWREPRMAFLGLWIGVGMLPSLLTSEAPSWPRTMLASPAALTLPALAVAAAAQRLRCCRSYFFADLGLCRLGRLTLFALLALSISLNAVLTARDLLFIWPRHHRVRYAFQSSLTEALRYLDAQADDSPVVMAGLSPHDMDPWTERCTLRRRDLAIRWVDVRSALVLPPRSARLVVLDITPMSPALAGWAGLDEGAVIARGDIVPRGGSEHDPHAPVFYGPAYTVYRLDTSVLRNRVLDAGRAVYAGSDPAHPVPLTDPPQFGDVVRMLGYEWLTPHHPGTPARLLTFWQVLSVGPRSTLYGEPSLRTFVHLLRGNELVTGVDVLGAAPDTWRPGDVVIQLHEFTYPQEGVYAVELGWYVPLNGPRLPVVGVNAPGERVFLSPLEVAR